MNVFERLDRALSYSEEEGLLLDAVRGLARDKLAGRAERLDRTAEFPWDNVNDIGALGLSAMYIPVDHGGAALSYAAYLECVRELSKACAATGIIWATTFAAVKPVIEFGTHEQMGRLLPRIVGGGLAALCITEAQAGCDTTAMTTRFRAEGDDIVVNGSKTFITNGDVADLYLVFGKWSDIYDDRRAISAVVVEKGMGGLDVLRTEDKMGIRASSTAALAFDGCRVPRANLLGEPGDGLGILFAALNFSRPSIAAHALGIARAAFEDAVACINARRQSGRRIIEFQGIQFMLADMATDLALCESWLRHVAAMIDGGVRDIAVEASMLKMRASDLARRIATDAVQLHGGYGYCKDYRVERLMRDAKICQIWEGTNQVYRQLIGRSFIET